MNNYLRVFPHVWPHRRKIFLSTFFAILVAVLWGLNLSAVYPIMKVLLHEDQTLQEYVNEEIAAASAEIDERTAAIQTMDLQIQALEAKSGPGSSEAKVELLKDQSRQQSKLSSASRNALVMNWLKTNIVPVLPEDPFDLLALILGILLGATLLKGLCVWTQDVLVGSVVELSAMSIRKASFRHILKLDYQTVSMNGSSDMMSRFTYDMTLLSQGLTLMGGKIVREPLKALICMIGAFYVCWQLTLMSLLVVPIVALFFYRIGKKLKHASHRMMESMSKIYKTLEETFEGFKIVTAFNAADKHRQRFHRDNKEYFKKALRIIKIDALTSPTTESLGLLAAFIALIPGTYLVLRGTREFWGITLTSSVMDFEDLALLYTFLAGVIDPVRKLSSTYSKVRRAGAAADRVFSIMDTDTLVKETTNPQPMPADLQSIEFQKIEFTYAGTEEHGASRGSVLDSVNLIVKAGEVVVVVGENGSGKSTLVNLLPRYYDPGYGAVCFDGIDIRDFSLQDLRNKIGVVTQETLLFDDTISENIRYGKPDATSEEIIQAAHQAHVTDFLDQLPDGLQTQVGGKGGRLSGGQRQRIALARAMIRNPSVLILDEATSAIDAKSEQLIHEALRSFSKGRTTFIITHSVSPKMLDYVTRIVVMEEGKMIASGPHEDLIRNCKVYQRLYQAQVEQKASDLSGNGLTGDVSPASQSCETERPQSPIAPPQILRIHAESGQQSESETAGGESEENLENDESNPSDVA